MWVRRMCKFDSIRFECICLVFVQPIVSFCSIPILDFPACIIGDSPPELTSDSLVIGDTAPYSWRNIFSCINLLRILNKLTKWKHSRVMMLVVFKAAPILKRTLKVRHALMQLYVLKLLKMQTKYLGRQWRKTNMKIISAIYEKVRHRIQDDWAFGNGNIIVKSNVVHHFEFVAFRFQIWMHVHGISRWKNVRYARVLIVSIIDDIYRRKPL